MKTIVNENKNKSDEFATLLKNNSFMKYELGIAIIDLKKESPEIFGYNMDHFIYPASTYKVFIGAEVLRRIELGDFSLEQVIEIKSPNDVDKDVKIFPSDSRSILVVGDKVTVNELLDLMLTRSDNTTSNTLIDLVTRESITENIIYNYGWQGSEVTRKFLDRKKDEPYQFSGTTMSCARHLAEFMYLVEKDKLVSKFVSQKLKDYLLRFDRGGRIGLFLDNEYVSHYRKGGWLETNLWNISVISSLKSFFKKGWSIIRWSNDVGVITGKNSKYVAVVLSVNKSVLSTSYFPMQKLAKVIYKFMEQ